MARKGALLAAGLAVSLVLCAGLVLVLILSRPRLIGFVPGSVVLQPEALGSEHVIVLRGSSPISEMARIEGVGVRFEGRRIVVEQYCVLWHPLSELGGSRAAFPLVIDKRRLHGGEGEYEVVYRASGGRYLSAGQFRVTRAEAERG